MKIRSFVSGLGMASIIFATAWTFYSCTPMITEEQMMQLKELRSKEKSLTDMIRKKKEQKKSLEGELGARKAELKKCQDDMEFVKQKLSEWPNCWPDYTPPVSE